ncbi:MAG: sugar nucleotide-binding protein [Candidatus Peribacteraceae bacterium]|nr:sugar nucleotide-binding protein [Candidatus Peribacteraceae bacterium]
MLMHSAKVSGIVIFGAKGFLGSEILKFYPGSAAPSCDIADPEAVREVLDSEKPSVVINAAGKTGRPNIDWCEEHKEETLRANVTGPLILLEECLKRGIRLVHLGTGCIYDGPPERIFTEEDPPNFFGSFYSLTKATSDMLLARFPVLQLRIRMPLDGTTNPRTLVMKLKKYRRLLDHPNSVTYLPDFFSALRTLIGRKATGIYNVVNPGTLSPYKVMCRYREVVDSSVQFERLTLDDLPTVVRAARSNCTLSCEKLKKEGIVLRPIEEALEEALSKIKAQGK